MTESERAAIKQALSWMSDHESIVFARGGQKAFDSMIKVAESLINAIAHPVQPHKNTAPDSLEVASLWAAFDASDEGKRCIEWAINGDHKGALFVAFRAGLREAIAQPAKPKEIK